MNAPNKEKKLSDLEKKEFGISLFIEKIMGEEGPDNVTPEDWRALRLLMHFVLWGWKDSKESDVKVAMRLVSFAAARSEEIDSEKGRDLTACVAALVAAYHTNRERVEAFIENGCEAFQKELSQEKETKH